MRRRRIWGMAEIKVSAMGGIFSFSSFIQNTYRFPHFLSFEYDIEFVFIISYSFVSYLFVSK